MDKNLSQLKKSANKLIDEASTYLQQHAHNPVNWFPWSSEALEQAKKNDKPIMLSIGYSACHWCHVMEEESFADHDTAKIINENFIPIKVDREERPDIDDIYMAAVQLMTGHGGWPLTVFITPDQKPFYGGTYFPKEDRHYGQHILPGFKTVLKAVSQAWQNQRTDIELNGKELTKAIQSITKQQDTESHLSSSIDESKILVESANKLLPIFDLTWGGFKGAPKFPQTLCLELCLQAAAKIKNSNPQAHKELLNAVETSLDRMAQGGIYDHLAGGFARYSTDEKWLVPHFEKMLYDNALLAEIYLDAFSYRKKEYWKKTACETLDFIITELTSDEGGFYSSLDADSEGHEGKFYTWIKSEIESVLGNDAEHFCQFYGVTKEGNFENDLNVLHLDPQKDNTETPKIKKLKVKLLNHRNKRIRPIRDEKIITSWTSLAISALVKGYQITGIDKYQQSAQKAAHFILNNLLMNDKLKRSYARGSAKLDAYLDDYAFFCKALIDLSSIDPNPIWLEKALYLSALIIERFFDKDNSDFFYTAYDHEKLITRTKNFMDGPIPAATSIALLSLLKLSLVTSDRKYEDLVRSVLNKYKSSFSKHPSQFATLITILDLAVNSPLSLVVVNGPNHDQNKETLLAAHNIYLSNKTVFVKDNERTYDQRLLLLQQKSIVENKTTIFPCQDYSCRSPITHIKDLKL